MAARALALIAAALVAACVLGPLAAVIWRAGGLGALGPADWSAIRFTLWQAAASAALSVGLAVPVARALARRRFVGRDALVLLLGAPFILPVIVAVLGLIAIFGRQGLISQTLSLFGLPPLEIYGVPGVLLAHVFFNLPLATRLLLHGWAAIPAERFRLAGTLDLSPWTVFRLIELPMLRRILPGAALVIFVICMTSFAVALTLGGGPRATTVELAIYQAFRFDFNLGKAASLALVQLALAGLAGLIALRVALPDALSAGLDRPQDRWDRKSRFDALWIVAVMLFLMLPLGSVVARGLGALPELPASVWVATLHSVQVAAASTALCIALALTLSGRVGTMVSLLGLALSPLVLGTGAFLLLRGIGNPFHYALPVTALTNALMSLPFALRALGPERAATEARFAPLSRALGLSRLGWWRWVMLPRLARPLGFAAGLTAALSLGDLGVITLFADPERATLPLEMYRLMQAYRLDLASGAALLLLLLSLGTFWIFDRLGRRHA